jgi:hypothetical protein
MKYFTKVWRGAIVPSLETAQREPAPHPMEMMDADRVAGSAVLALAREAS